MIRHLASIAEIVEDVEAAVCFYRDLGLEVQYAPGSPYAQIALPGVLHFGLWQRQAAAQSVYGDPSAADRIPLGFSIGFEVDGVAEASAALTGTGRTVAQAPQTESWGQTTSRFFSPSGALCEFSEAPWARRLAQPIQGTPE